MRGVIYYPFINPPQSWVKQALLYWDRVCTVVPTDYPGDVEDLLHPDLHWLRQQGIYEPLTADSISSSQIDDLREETLTYLAKAEPELPLRPNTRTAMNQEFVHFGKIPAQLEHDLAELGLLERTRDNLVLSSAVMDIVVCLIAKHLSQTLSRHPDTDFAVYTHDAPFARAAFEPVEGLESTPCLQIVLEDFLPVPGDTVGLQAVLAFREKNRESLHALRKAIRRLEESSVAISGDETGVKEEITEALLGLHAAFKRDRLQRSVLSLSVFISILGVDLPGIVGKISRLAFGGSAPAALIRWLDTSARQGPAANDYSYLYKSVRHFDQ